MSDLTSFNEAKTTTMIVDAERGLMRKIGFKIKLEMRI